MHLTFDLNEEDDMLNTTILDAETGSVMYTVETPQYSRGTLTTTVTRRSQHDGSTRFAFRILWKRARRLFEDVTLVLDHRTLEEIPVGQLLERARGTATYGSIHLDDVEYRWKSKGTGSKIVLIDKQTREVVAQSRSRIRGGLFKKPRDMRLEISEKISYAVDVVLLTFILVWRERQNMRPEGMHIATDVTVNEHMVPIPVALGQVWL